MQVKKEDKDERELEKQKQFCRYCKANDPVIKDCPKLAAKEVKKKESGMVATDISTTP